MELDSKGLSRLLRVADPREVWASEASDFTPWLAENLDVLANELGLSLTLTGREVQVGSFWLDIQAETPDGDVVVIENQLERTDHSHLGQLLLYASGLEAAAVVWVAPVFREEFRRALDWLNERTDNGVNSFGVTVEIVQIGDTGPRAPVFEVVARPNSWQKAVKTTAGGGTQASKTARNADRQAFFTEVLTDVNVQRPQIRVPAPSKESWMPFASGPFGNWDISIAADGRIRVNAYLDTGDQTTTEHLFDTFAAQAEEWEAHIGLALEWLRLDDRRACRIATFHPPVELDQFDVREDAKRWAVSAILSMYDTLNNPLRDQAARLKSGEIGP